MGQSNHFIFFKELMCQFFQFYQNQMNEQDYPSISVFILAYLIIFIFFYYKMQQQNLTQQMFINQIIEQQQQHERKNIQQQQLHQPQVLNQKNEQTKSSSLIQRLTFHYDIIQKQKVTSSLTQIFNFYCKSYNQIHPLKNATFQQMRNEYNILSFQPFHWFCKQFKLVPTIFSLERIKILFKKYSNYGKFLTLFDFINLINNISHQKECNNFFHGHDPEQQHSEEQQCQFLYNYLQLNNKENYQKNFKALMKPFESTDKPNYEILPFQYRKMSLPELLKKAIPQKYETKQEKEQKKKDLYISKAMNLKPIQKKPNIISWDTVTKKALSLQKVGEKRVQKYFSEDNDDGIFLKQYENNQEEKRGKGVKNYDDILVKQSLLMQKRQKQQIQKRIDEIEKIEREWSKKVYEQGHKRLK